MDVTPQLAALIQRGQSAVVTNDLFGRDPAPGEYKRLRVVGRDRRGRERVVEIAENNGFDAGDFTLGAYGGGSPGGPGGDSGGWRIVHARWGVGQANMDVTQRLRELARSDRRFRISNELFGNDPAPGVVKSLRIVATDASGRRQRFEFPEGSSIDGQQFVGWGRGDWGDGDGDWNDGDPSGPTRPDARLVIERAEYTSDDGRRMDVTWRLQDLADRHGRLDLRVSNREMGGDPAEGVPKRLWVRWRANGRTRDRSWREGERLVLP
jgi:hypothetical protein